MYWWQLRQFEIHTPFFAFGQDCLIHFLAPNSVPWLDGSRIRIGSNCEVYTLYISLTNLRSLVLWFLFVFGSVSVFHINNIFSLSLRRNLSSQSICETVTTLWVFLRTAFVSSGLQGKLNASRVEKKWSTLLGPMYFWHLHVQDTW